MAERAEFPSFACLPQKPFLFGLWLWLPSRNWALLGLNTSWSICIHSRKDPRRAWLTTNGPIISIAQPRQ
jgi:hypothetical protein